MAFDFTAIFGDAESMTKEQLETALQQRALSWQTSALASMLTLASIRTLYLN